MVFKVQESEIAKLDYQLEKEKIDKEICEVLCGLKNKFSDGIWLEEIEINEIRYNQVLFRDKGIFIFLKHEKELADPLLWQEMKEAHNVFCACFDYLDEASLSFYVLLNSPITQKVHFGLFNPSSEFVIPIKNLEESILAELEQREVVYLEDELMSLVSYVEGAIKEEGNNEDVFSDETGEYIYIRGKLKRRSDVDPEKYYWLTLFGGLFGIHKFYAKCYGSFFAYFFTLGFVGIGWMVDLAEICFGVSKDRKKAYIGPFEDLKSKRFVCLVAMVVYGTVVIVFDYIFL